MKHTFFSVLATSVGLSIGAAAITASPALAVVDQSTSNVNTNEGGLALHGYDPVAYFTAGQPTKGSSRYQVGYGGATYHFASAENRDAFKANPATYAPQFGGFCAMGVSLEKKLDGNPHVWKIVDNKLYLNVNEDVAKAWSRDVPGNIDRAEDNWPEVHNQTPASLNN